MLVKRVIGELLLGQWPDDDRGYVATAMVGIAFCSFIKSESLGGSQITSSASLLAHQLKNLPPDSLLRVCVLFAFSLNFNQLQT